nr:MAG TPA: Protein of unknown function (DUF1366) [Caudoviricetes sp.]
MENKYTVTGKVLKLNVTEVSIYREYPYTYITRSLAGNQLNKSDEELIQSVLEIMNIEFDPTSTIAKLTALSNEVKENLAQVKELGEHTKKNSETAQKSLLELTEQVFNLSADVEALKGSHDEEHEEQPTGVENHASTEETHSEGSSTGTISTPTDGAIASN